MKANFARYSRDAASTCATRRRGIILIVVMVVIVMISLAGFSFAALMYTENKAVRLRGDELQLQNIVASGSELLTSMLEQPWETTRDLGGLYNNSEVLAGVVVTGDDKSERRGLFTVISPRYEDAEVVGLRFGVEDESARLNLAVLPLWEKMQPGSGRKALMHLPGMTESIADSLLDWIDDDSEPRTLGAEDDYYRSLPSPYTPRNGIPETIEELLLVKGVTHALLFGADANRNHYIDADEARRAADHQGQAVDVTQRPWATFLTVYSADRERDPTGRPKIDLNSSDLVRLHQSLVAVFDEKWARFIIAYRQFGPDAGEEPSTSNVTIPLDTAKAAKFQISSLLDLIDARVKIPTSASDSSSESISDEQTIFASPLTGSRDQMRVFLPKLFAYATTSKTRVVRGRININRATAEVLYAIPGIDEGLVEQLIAQRSTQSADTGSEHRHPTWLLTEGLVDLHTMKKLMPFLTGYGSVHRAQIVGFFDNGGPVARVELVIDTAASPPRQLYWKDLGVLGRGYPNQALGIDLTD